MRYAMLAMTIFCLIYSMAVAAEMEPIQPFSIPPETMRGPTAVHQAPEELSLPAGADGGALKLQQQSDLIRELTLRAMLSPVAEQALAICPDWLKMDLLDIFMRMNASTKDEYSQLLLDIEDPRLIDEVAFTIAHSSPSVLSRSDPALYVKNAELIYEIAPYLPYAEIVDHGEPGVDPDFYSTVLYTTLASGATVQFELPMDVYYWYLVHPKHGDEEPSMDPTLTERTSTYGYLYREYYFFNPSEEYDYSLYYMTKAPNMLTDEDVTGWGPTAPSYLSTSADGIIVGGPEIERPLLIEYHRSYGRVIATTMEVEAAYNAGHPEALENLVMRSSGHQGELLISRSAGGTYWDQCAIVDETGDSDILNPILDVLNNHEIGYMVKTVDEMLDMEWERYFTKVIVPSHQSRETYEALAGDDFKSKYGAWMGTVGGTLEFHGACDPDDDYSDLAPFGVRCIFEEVNTGIINRYPVLGDVIANATYVWDDTFSGSKPRYRPFEPGSMAVDVITNWASRMLMFQARGNRPIQANQICFEHNGNCGEIQDIITAAGRTCLIPSAGASNHTWDHVVSQFWDRGWHGWQVGWNVGGADIAKQGILADDDFGGGKKLSAILQDRGDTYPVNVTERFSKVCTFRARVEDIKGAPVDCAEIKPWVRYFNKPTERLVSPLSDYTDSSGEVVMNLGNGRDFWFEVKSAVGNARREQILTETVADEEYSHTWVIEGRTAPQLPEIESIEFPPVVQGRYKLLISFDVDYETLYSLSKMSFAEKREASANVDFFITKSADFDKYSDDEAFAAYEWREDTKSAEFEVEIPDDEAYYLVFSNEDTLIAKEFVSISIDVFKKEAEAWIQAESYTNFVGIPAGTSYVLMFNNRRPPSVHAAGYFNAYVSSSTSSELGVQAFILDPDGPRDVNQVELCYGGIGLGKYLTDNGSGDDAAAGDGIFTFSERFPAGSLLSGLYKLELRATDMAGNHSPSWPYLNVLSAPMALASPLSSMNTRIWQPAATAESAPVIIGGGYFGDETVQPGELFRLMILVADPDGPDDIDRVELFLEGGVETGYFLSDDGLDGDDHAGDGIFTFQTFVPPDLSAGSVLLEVVAFDKSGNSSATYPYFKVD